MATIQKSISGSIDTSSQSYLEFARRILKPTFETSYWKARCLTKGFHGVFYQVRCGADNMPQLSAYPFWSHMTEDMRGDFQKNLKDIDLDADILILSLYATLNQDPRTQREPRSRHNYVLMFRKDSLHFGYYDSPIADQVHLKENLKEHQKLISQSLHNFFEHFPLAAYEDM